MVRRRRRRLPRAAAQHRVLRVLARRHLQRRELRLRHGGGAASAADAQARRQLRHDGAPHADRAAQLHRLVAAG